MIAAALPLLPEKVCSNLHRVMSPVIDVIGQKGWVKRGHNPMLCEVQVR